VTYLHAAATWLNRHARHLLPLGAVLALLGYFGPWINHAAAGLVVTGLDLAEYVKFLPEMLAGRLPLWREGFYLPLVAVSLALSLHAFDARLRYGWLWRIILLALALVAALNLLPPAWTPQRMLTPEFRQQALVLGALVLAVAISPFLALLPAWLRSGATAFLATLAMWVPVRSFLRIVDDISMLYNHQQSPAWGMYVMLVGLFTLAALGVAALGVRHENRHSH
jgi:hypothetical protein